MTATVITTSSRTLKVQEKLTALEDFNLANDAALSTLARFSQCVEENLTDGSRIKRPGDLFDDLRKSMTALALMAERSGVLGASALIEQSLGVVAATFDKLLLYMNFDYQGLNETRGCVDAVKRFRDSLGGLESDTRDGFSSIESCIRHLHQEVDKKFGETLADSAFALIYLSDRAPGIVELFQRAAGNMVYYGNKQQSEFLASPVGGVAKSFDLFCRENIPQFVEGPRFFFRNCLVTDLGFHGNVKCGMHLTRLTGAFDHTRAKMRFTWTMNEPVNEQGRMYGWGRRELCRALFSEVSFAYSFSGTTHVATRTVSLLDAAETALFLAFVTENLKDVDISGKSVKAGEMLAHFRNFTVHLLDGQATALG